jgi:hypothetical protein
MVVAMLLAAGTAWGAPRLVWDPNPPEENVTQYTVYWGATSRHDPAFQGYDESRDTGTTELLLPLPDDTDATYFGAVVARSASGLSSDYSTEVTIDIGNPTATASGGGGGGGCFLGLLTGKPAQPDR